MDLTELLKPEAVKVVGSVTSKKRLFHDLGDLVNECHTLDSEAAIAALQERENLGPTGVGHGVALPHARLAGLSSVVGCFLKLDHAVDFDAIDRQPVDLVFALFAPENSGVDHLKALALVSRTLRDQTICKKLRANSDTSALHAILTEVPATQAA